jgi:CHAT domain
MKSLYFYVSWLFLVSILFFSCSGSRTQKRFPRQIRDYVHGAIAHPQFYRADSLKYAQDYPKALILFEKLMMEKQLSKDERIYTLNQMAFICLKMRQTQRVGQIIEQLKPDKSSFSKKQLADYLYNCGVFYLQRVKPVIAKQKLEAALAIYQREYARNHLHVALTWAQLALHQVDFGIKAEDVNHIAETAYQHFYPRSKKNMLLRRYAAELNYAMAQYYRMVSRDYLAGLNHCALAEKLIRQNCSWHDTVLWARCLGVKGLLLRKGREYDQADSVMNKGLSLLDDHDGSSIFIPEMYRFLLVNTARRPGANTQHNQRADSLYHVYWNQLNGYLKEGIPQKYIDTTQIKAYYCYYRRAQKKEDCLNNLTKLVSAIHPDLPSYRYYVEEAYNFLATLYLEDEEFDTALVKQLVSFKTEIQPDLAAQIKNWSDALLPKFAYKRINPFFGFAKAGNIYLKKYQKWKNIEDLVMSLRLYDAADKAMSLSLTMSKDGVLSYQQEIGNEVYHGGLETLLVAWNLKDKFPQKFDKDRILNLAFRFFERQKSFILFREDLLKNDAEISIRKIKRISEKITSLSNNKGNRTDLETLSSVYFEYQQELNKLYEQSIGRFNQDIQPFELIRSRLKSEQVLVQYKVCGNFTYVLAASTKGFVFDTVGKTSMVRGYLLPFSNLLRQPYGRYMSSLVDSSKIMYLKFIQPFEKVIPLTTAELIIIPDNFLTDIPFEAFPLPSNMDADRWRKLKYLLHKHNIVYAPSWKIWEHHRKLKTLNRCHRAAFFSYSLKENPSSKFELSKANLEYNAMAFMKTVPFIGKEDCTPEMFAKWTFRYKLLHLSLHGKSNRDSLNANQVFFKITNNRLAGVLKGDRIASLALNGKWAIISACETGTGISNAEGTYSLARAFLQAGCEFTVSSLWKMQSDASSEIISQFYHYVKKGDLPWVALTKAKQDFLKDNNVPPYVWAALVPAI